MENAYDVDYNSNLDWLYGAKISLLQNRQNEDSGNNENIVKILPSSSIGKNKIVEIISPSFPHNIFSDNGDEDINIKPNPKQENKHNIPVPIKVYSSPFMVKKVENPKFLLANRRRYNSAGGKLNNTGNDNNDNNNSDEVNSSRSKSIIITHLPVPILPPSEIQREKLNNYYFKSNKSGAFTDRPSTSPCYHNSNSSDGKINSLGNLLPSQLQSDYNKIDGKENLPLPSLHHPPLIFSSTKYNNALQYPPVLFPSSVCSTFSDGFPTSLKKPLDTDNSAGDNIIFEIGDGEELSSFRKRTTDKNIKVCIYIIYSFYF
jgi:hypothetical protein